MNLSTTLQKFISNSESIISNLTVQIESNKIEIQESPRYSESYKQRNEEYRIRINRINAEIKTAQDTLSSL